MWTSEDTENYAAQMMNILELVDLISSLIEIDLTKLEMPAYL
jgi:hypothetical protein